MQGVGKGNAGRCQQGLGMLKQPGLGAHLELWFQRLLWATDQEQEPSRI